MNAECNVLLGLLAIVVLLANAYPHLNVTGPAFAVGPGMIMGQIVLATAGVVLSNRMLWLRLAILAIALAVGASWFAAWTQFNPMQAMLSTTSIALITAAWCGGLRFFGWRVARRETGKRDVEPSGQYSLATLMLVMMTISIFLAASRATHDAPLAALWQALIGVAFAVPGCLALLITARSSWACFGGVALAIPAALFLVAIVSHDPNLRFFTSAAAWIIGAELAFVAGVLIVLRVAGISLAPTMPRGSEITQHYSTSTAVAFVAQ